RIALATFKAMLDTVRVRARRIADVHDSGFEQRRRSGGGKYLTSDDIAKRGAAFTSGILRTISGLRVNRTETGEAIQMRGIFQDADWCTPEFYIDGRYMFSFDGEDLDASLLP